MKKQSLALLLVLSLLLTGCGGAASQEEVAGTIAPAQTEAAAEERPVSMGRIEGGTYTNAYAGFSCTLDSNWEFYGADELQELPENAKAAMEGSELGDSIDTLNQFTDMLAENVENFTTINVLYQKHSMEERLAFAMMNEEQIIDNTLQMQDQLVEAYAQAGIEVESLEKVTVNFLGEERTAIHMSSMMEGVPYYTLQLFYYDLGQYSITLTLASFVDDNTGNLLQLFAPAG